MFIREGAFAGLICKFAIYVMSSFPLMGKPTIKINCPTTYEHPLLNRVDNKCTMPEWNADKDSLITIIDFIRNLFVVNQPTKKNPSPSDYVAMSVRQAFEEPGEKDDIFARPKWTPELLKLKEQLLAEEEAEESDLLPNLLL
jgi:hypothetical protein